MKKLWSLLLSVVLLWSCGHDAKEECVTQPDIDNIQIDVTIDQLQDTLANIQSKQQLVNFLTREPLIRDYIFQRTLYPSDSAFIDRIYSRCTNPYFDSLLLETKRAFGDLSSLKKEFEQAFARMKYYYPDFNPPKIKTLISGLLDKDFIVTDSLIIISIDFFMGTGSKYRPDTFEYILRMYEKENIVPSCMLMYGISDRFNKTDPDDKSVLADMVAYGKSFYFAKHMLPCVPDSILIWYSAEEIDGARKHQDLIWARLIQDEVLYSTSHVLKQKYLQERPKTLEVGEKCPGRIAQWVGWQIVDSYMKTHADITLPEMMEITNAQQLFKESRYKPQK
jgi:hypothetical protein